MEKDRDKIWIATQEPVNNSPTCETYAVYLMYTRYLTKEVLIPQGYHLIKGPVLENAHDLEILKLPEQDWDTSLAALNQKYPPPNESEPKTGDSEGDEEEEAEIACEGPIVCCTVFGCFVQCLWVL